VSMRSPALPTRSLRHAMRMAWTSFYEITKSAGACHLYRKLYVQRRPASRNGASARLKTGRTPPTTDNNRGCCTTAAAALAGCRRPL
jgi:hypothetical protein